jgi:hypothetical protein
MLFSDRSVWTMLHGIVLGGGSLLALSAAMFFLCVAPAGANGEAGVRQQRALSLLLVGIAALLWMTTLGGTYVVFPLYRASPPEGLAELSQYPRALLLKNPDTQWLHRFAMEIKEHVPWIASMFATAAAFIGVRYRTSLLADRGLRGIVTALTALGLALVGWIALLGVFVNKVAPVE